MENRPKPKNEIPIELKFTPKLISDAKKFLEVIVKMLAALDLERMEEPAKSFFMSLFVCAQCGKREIETIGPTEGQEPAEAVMLSCFHRCVAITVFPVIMYWVRPAHVPDGLEEELHLGVRWERAEIDRFIKALRDKHLVGMRSKTEEWLNPAGHEELVVTFYPANDAPSEEGVMVIPMGGVPTGQGG